MGLTSAAEARLDARIRPDITTLRSRTPYPRRHRPALAVLPGGADRPDGAEAELVPRTARSQEDRSARTDAVAGPAGQGGRVGQLVRADQAVRNNSEPQPHNSEPRPITLTRRGRMVVGALVVIAVAGIAAMIWVAVAGRAQAAGHVRPGTPAAHSMLRVVVRPGDTLWSIAAKADPAADPRIVIQQIVDDNALSGTAISAGQVLWVPRA
jgi:nucleoid-associated protein YgaU